ncbi:hypothetical protein Pcinc_034645 [Petrolisthes cinctipes]|uniref:Uncharacterized protein n=1 Tax=Petrolisthes cinctipes TaxID=88211 RepID=A0AAE1C175_PETCI|nr:hypothetical protein Pcinc_034645 [Petrolisthes cinctipes]
MGREIFKYRLRNNMVVFTFDYNVKVDSSLLLYSTSHLLVSTLLVLSHLLLLTLLVLSHLAPLNSSPLFSSPFSSFLPSTSSHFLIFLLVSTILLSHLLSAHSIHPHPFNPSSPILLASMS